MLSIRDDLASADFARIKILSELRVLYHTLKKYQDTVGTNTKIYYSINNTIYEYEPTVL